MEKTVTESFIKARQVCCSHHPTPPTHPPSPRLVTHRRHPRHPANANANARARHPIYAHLSMPYFARRSLGFAR